MKLTLKKGDKEMSLDVIESRIEGSISDFIVNLYKKLFVNSDIVALDMPKMDSETLDKYYSHSSTEPLPVERDSFTIRKRIPNNVIDLTQLDVKQAITEAALVRCPECGQSHAIILMDGDKLYLMRRNYSIGEFGIVCLVSPNDEEMMRKIRPNGNASENKLNYFIALQGMAFLDDKDFNVANDTEIFCPVCGKSSPFIKWKDAYENKENYFEYQYVCGVCGGECVMDAKDEKESNETVVCTECGRKWMKGQV